MLHHCKMLVNHSVQTQCTHIHSTHTNSLKCHLLYDVLTLSSSSEVGRLVWSLVRHCSVKLANLGDLHTLTTENDEQQRLVYVLYKECADWPFLGCFETGRRIARDEEQCSHGMHAAESWERERERERDGDSVQWVLCLGTHEVLPRRSQWQWYPETIGHSVKEKRRNAVTTMIQWTTTTNAREV